MNYQVTILNLIGYIGFSIVLIHSIVNYSNLSRGEGWGMVGMLSLMGLASICIAADYLIQKATCNQANKLIKRNVYGIVFLVMAAIYLFIRNAF